MSNHYVTGYGTTRLQRTIGGGVVTADFNTRCHLFLTPIGIIKEDIDYNLNARLKGFRGKMAFPVENDSATTAAQLINLLNMISDLVYTGGTANKTITLIPSYSSESNAVNQSFEVMIKFDTDISGAKELAENVESVQYWEFSFIVLSKIVTLPTGFTTVGDTILTGDDDEILTGDDDENLTEG